jgi:uncharacterized membrane protein
MKLRKNVENWERAASIALGAGLVVMAARRRQLLSGTSTSGLALIARGASGFCPVNAATGRGRRRDDTRAALGGARGVVIQESVTIARPRAEIFEFWSDPRHLSGFMRHVERVDVIGNGRTHWVMRGPAGVRVEWDAETINEVEPELIAWRTLPGADVASAGSVHFRARGDEATEVTVRMQYDPPAGKAGAALAWLIGQSPAADLREDLRRLKQVLEAGEVPTVEGQPSGPRSATFQMFGRVHA